MLNLKDVSTVRSIAYLLRNATEEQFDAVCNAFGEESTHVKREVSCYYNDCKFDPDQIIQQLIQSFEQLQEFSLYYDNPESEWRNVIITVLYSTAYTEEEIRQAIYSAIQKHCFLDGYEVETIDPLVKIVQSLKDNFKID